MSLKVPTPFPSPYRVADDGVTLYTDFSPLGNPVLYNDEENQCKRNVLAYDRRFNRGLRRDDIILFAGDLPVIAFGAGHRDASLFPPMPSMGEFNFAVEENGESLLLSQAAHVHTEYYPGGVRWTVTPKTDDDLRLFLEADLLTTKDVIVRLTTNRAVALSLTIDNQRKTARTLDATWFFNATPLSCTVSALDSAADAAYAIDVGEPFFRHAQVHLWGNINSASCDNNVIKVNFTLKPDETFAAQGLISLQDTDIDPALAHTSLASLCDAAEQAIIATKARLDRVHLNSGDTYLDAGFHNSVQEMDYLYWTPAWMECGQFWGCYWTNNYQMSAATSLGDWDLSRRALAFFGLIPEGFNATAPIGKPAEMRYDENGELIRFFDGMPYYMYQLYRFIDGGGKDGLKLLEEVFDNIHLNNLSMIKYCDPTDTGLYGFHQGCNSFMQQADHLAIPGEGTSPSIMMAYGFRLLAKLLNQIGKNEEADFYTKTADRTMRLLDKLWSDNGYYLGQIDAAGDQNHAHYYTDLTFPTLYSADGDISDVRKLLSLLHLQDTLVYISETTGLPLLKVSDYLPSIFANDCAHCIQQCETAVALFKMGMCDLAFGLLKSCGLAYSVFTESPGSAPERLSYDGRGEANYAFGTSAAVFPASVIEGLFGLVKKDGGKTLRFAPAWLPDETLSFHWLGVYLTAANGRFTLNGTGSWDNVEFSVCVPAGSKPVLTCNGVAVDYDIQPLLNCRRITATFPAQENLCWEVTVEKQISHQLSPVFRRIGEPLAIANMANGQMESISRAGLHHVLVEADGCYVDQPVVVIPAFSTATATLRDRELVICGVADPRCRNAVRFTVAGSTFDRTLAVDADGNFCCRLMMPARLLLPAYAVDYQLTGDTYAENGSIRAENQSFIDFAGWQLDLTPYLNADTVNGDSPWRIWYPLALKLTADDCLNTTHCRYRLATNDDGVCRVCHVEKGRSIDFTRRINPSAHPNTVEITVNKTVGAISLLYQADVDVRLTEDVIGSITLEYADGSESCVLLESGKTVGALFRNFARDTVHIPVPSTTDRDSVNHYAIPCDETRVLRAVRITVDKEDARFALIAANIYSTLPDAWNN